MSDYERLLSVLAQELERNISNCFRHVADEAEWVDSDLEARDLMRRFRGIFIASLVGEIEEKVGRGFASLFDQLSDQPTLKESKHWFVDMPRRSSLRGRARVMWAIRIAYTHGNGSVAQVSDPDVAAYLDPEFANQHFRGVRCEEGKLLLFKDVTFPALKTVLAISEKFGLPHLT